MSKVLHQGSGPRHQASGASHVRLSRNWHAWLDPQRLKITWDLRVPLKPRRRRCCTTALGPHQILADPDLATHPAPSGRYTLTNTLDLDMPRRQPYPTLAATNPAVTACMYLHACVACHMASRRPATARSRCRGAGACSSPAAERGREARTAATRIAGAGREGRHCSQILSTHAERSSMGALDITMGCISSRSQRTARAAQTLWRSWPGRRAR